MTIIPAEEVYFSYDIENNDLKYLDQRFVYQSSLEDLAVDIEKELDELHEKYVNVVIQIHSIYKKILNTKGRYNDYAYYIQEPEIDENAEDQELQKQTHKIYEYTKARHWLNNRWSDQADTEINPKEEPKPPSEKPESDFSVESDLIGYDEILKRYDKKRDKKNE